MCLTVTSAPDNMSKVTRIGDLYDFYGTLLTDRGRQMIEMYHVEDWSLGEIAQALSISRQAVHDQLRRAGEQLEGYEASLQLCALAERQRLAWRTLSDSWKQVNGHVPASLRETMEDALHQMSQTLSSLMGGDGDA